MCPSFKAKPEERNIATSGGGPICTSIGHVHHWDRRGPWPKPTPSRGMDSGLSCAKSHVNLNVPAMWIWQTNERSWFPSNVLWWDGITFRINLIRESEKADGIILWVEGPIMVNTLQKRAILFTFAVWNVPRTIVTSEGPLPDLLQKQTRLSNGVAKNAHKRPNQGDKKLSAESAQTPIFNISRSHTNLAFSALSKLYNSCGRYLRYYSLAN